MNILEFVDRAIIIDNKEEEINTLRAELIKQDIDVSFYNPDNDAEISTYNKNRQLIFVDLMLDEGATPEKANISRLVTILCTAVSSSFGPYGIVVWSKHVEHTKIFKQILSMAVNSTAIDEEKEGDDEVGGIKHLAVAPMFVTELSKTKYLEHGYGEVLLDIENKVKESTAGYFFMSWSRSVKTAMKKTIENIYGLCNDFQKHESQISYLLNKLAINHTGIDSPEVNKTVDCYKAFDEILYANLFVQQKDEAKPELHEQELPWETEEWRMIISKLNAKICIDIDAISQNVIVPGNVYILKGKTINKIIQGKFTQQKEKEGDYKYEEIAIELTPPCDASNKKMISSRVVSGFACAIPTGKTKKELDKLYKAIRSENRYLLKSVWIDGINYAIVFDYRYLFTPNYDDLIDETKYKVWFRAKPKLFADILQKFSSHAARLGLSDIHEEL